MKRRGKFSVRKIFKQPLLAGRFRAMPDMMDRARIAGVVALAAFTALVLALLSHFALAGDPLTLPGLGGKGEVLTAPAERPASPQSSRSAAPGPATSPAGFSTGTVPLSGAGSAGSPAAVPPRQAGAPKLSNSGPRTVGVSVGDAASSAPPATAPPSPSSGSGASTGSGSSGTAGTGGPQQDPTSPPTTTQPPSPANDWNHSPVGPPAQSTGSTSGRSGSTAGKPATGSSSGKPATSVSGTRGAPSASGSATSVGKPSSQTTSATGSATSVAGKVKSYGSH